MSSPAPPALGAASVPPTFEEKVRRAFLVEGRLRAFPRKQKKLLVLLADVATRFLPGVSYPEREVNATLSRVHDDVATLRRALVDHRFMTREAGVYRRVA